MTDLFDQLAHRTIDDNGVPIHNFIARLQLYALGVLTRAETVAGLGLTAESLVQAGQVADSIDAATGFQDKSVTVLRLEGVFILLGTLDPRYYDPVTDTIDRATVIADAGI